MKLIFDKNDNLNDKDLITLCSTDLGVFNIINIKDILNYYDENNYSSYDIILSILEFIYGDSYYKVTINGHEIQRNTTSSLRIFISQLDEYIEGIESNESYSSLKDLSEKIKLIDYFTNEYELSNTDTQRKIKELVKYDRDNGGKIKEYIDKSMINHERFQRVGGFVDSLILLQYLFGVRCNMHEHGIFKSGHLETRRNVPGVLMNMMMELVDKKNDGDELDLFESRLYDILINLHWKRIKRGNLDNLRYIKMEYRSKSLDYLNKIMDLNDKIEDEIKDICLLTDNEYENFIKFKTKLVKYSLERTM